MLMLMLRVLLVIGLGICDDWGDERDAEEAQEISEAQTHNTDVELL